MPKEEKSGDLKKLEDLLRQHKTIGIVDMYKMPTKQMQQIKIAFGERALIKVSKKSLMEMALKNSGKDISNYLPTQPGLIITNMQPFEFFREATKLKFKTYAKEGYISGEDVEVKPGPTELLPGPAISELQKVGIIAGVEGGKIAIKKASVILKKDQVVSKEMSGVLRKLKLQIAEIKLNVHILFDGSLYNKETLELVEVYPQKLSEAFKQALNLSVSINYPTKENVKYLLLKAYQRGKAIESKTSG